MPSQQFRSLLQRELARLQDIRVATEHDILCAYMSTRDYRQKSSKRTGGIKRFFMMRIA